MNPSPRSCPQCGQPRPPGTLEGLCPRCVAKFSFGIDEEAPAAAPDPPGSVRQFGDYELLEEIGRGGMGVVYRARQLSLNRLVAVKMIPFGSLATAESIQRFRAEAEAAAHLQHPHIIAIHEIGDRDGQHFFSMELVEGRTLGELLADGPLPARRGATILRTVAEAVHFAHGRGILHRDLKPSNILLDARGEPRVTDFGLAKRLAVDSDLTLTGQVLGSPHYMAPEQAAGKPAGLGPAADIYSLGAMLYHVLTGRPPFQAESVEAVLLRLASEEPPSPRLLNPALPRDLETLCLKCLAKEPRGRYASAGELAEELGRFLRDEPILARPAGRVEKMWRWCRRKPALAGALGLALLAGGIGAAGVFAQWRRAETARADTARHLYAADMELAFRALAAGDAGQAQRLLELHRPGVHAGGQDLRGWEWRFLWQQTRGPEWQALGRHAGAVPALDISPDGRWLASADVRGALRLWDIAGARVLLTTNLGRGRIQALAFSSDGTVLAHTTAHSEVWLWDTRRWAPLGVLSEFNVSHVAFSPDGTTLATANGQIVKLWNVATRQPWKSVPQSGARAQPRLVAFASDGPLLIGDAAGYVTSWDWRTDTEASRGWKAHTAAPDGSDKLNAIVHSSRGQLVATAGGDNIIQLRRRGTPGVWMLTNHADAVTCVAFSPDSRLLVSGGLDQKLRLWEVTQQRELAAWHGHAGGCLQVRFVPGGQAFASSGMDGLVKLWTLGRIATPAPEVLALPSEVSDVALVAQPPVVAFKTFDAWQLWRLPDGTPLSRGAYGRGHYFVVRSAAAGRLLECDWRTIQFHGTSNGTVERVVPWELGPSVSLDLSRDGRILVGSGKDAAVVWDVPSRQILRRWPTPEEGLGRLVRVAPDGSCVATLQRFDGTVTFWDVATGRTHALAGHMTGASVLGFSEDGRRMATVGLSDSGRGAAIRIYDVRARRQVASVEAGAGRVSAVAFSPEGSRLVCGTDKGPVVLLDLETGRQIARLDAHRAEVRSVVFLDANTLASATTGEIRFWRATGLASIDRARAP